MTWVRCAFLFHSFGGNSRNGNTRLIKAVKNHSARSDGYIVGKSDIAEDLGTHSETYIVPDGWAEVVFAVVADAV